ncbi:hypothetical protein ACFPK1_32265 [Actinomycetospora rhizophila]|uniref:DUF2169 domain-containing protein n=1 Tax=Actinomycetospora rhizophila TaxID=1416876 RepID=A0ABV9ZQL8_9PSEU
MPYRYDLVRRLEPARPAGDLDRGFRAEIADPAWFLAVQWRMGEHAGEDAASPVGVTIAASATPLDPLGGDPALDPQVVPAEILVEAEAGDWWTPGRRVRIGLSVGAAHPLPDDPSLLLEGLPPPYDGLRGLDGRTLYERRDELGLPESAFAGVPTSEPPDCWDPAELVHTARFTAGGSELDLPRHDGGDVDWYAVSATRPVVPPAPPEELELTPARLRYPGAPHPRWWQIENARVDVGGFPPDRSHLATMLLIDLVVSHADNWFTVPVPGRVGTVSTLHEVVVRNAFDEKITLGTPATWGLFHVDGLDPTSLVVWPTTTTPLCGPVEDDVLLGVDEDANVLWAIERRVAGRDLAPPDPPVAPAPPVPDGELRADLPATYRYRPGTPAPRYWHPYVVADDPAAPRRFVQGTLLDLEQRPPVPLPEPRTPLLRNPAAGPADPVHHLEPATVPTTGLHLERRWMLGRAADGRPQLWRQRRRLPNLALPASGLRFDVLEETPAVSPPR